LLSNRLVCDLARAGGGVMVMMDKVRIGQAVLNVNE